jgi:predicted porin
MRRTLLASAAIIGATNGLAIAQDQNAPNPTQGQYIAPLRGGPSAQNNNNTWATPITGSAATPTPGTVIIRLNGKVYAEADLTYGSGLQTAKGTIVPASGAASNTSGYKLNPVGVASTFRLYPGIDGMATNGLRYGAAVEIRENFEGGNNFAVSSATAANPAGTSVTTNLPSGTATSGTNASASGNSSSETLFVRRAFVYLAADQFGIFRIGQQDGLPGIFDYAGTFTVGTWDGGIGNLNGPGGFQFVAPNQYTISFPWLSGSGAEYGNSKVVYVTPQFAGFDFGVEYGPNQGNILGDSSTSSPLQVGPCNTASADCVNVTSGTDSSRWINRAGFGGRYIGNFAGVTLQGYGVYIVSGKAQIAGGGTQASPANLAANPAVAGLAGGGTAAGSLRYDGQSFFNGGIALTYFGFTLNADFTTGRTNGSNALDPTGGAPMMGELIGLSYAFGPLSVGVLGAIVDSQGSAELVHTSQRHEAAIVVGGAYRIAPGINLAVEYQYEQKHQGAFNFNTGANGVSSGNDIHGQGLTVATIVNW